MLDVPLILDVLIILALGGLIFVIFAVAVLLGSFFVK